MLKTSAASEPLITFIIVIYDICPTYSFLPLFPLEKSRIDYFMVILNIYYT